MPEQQVAEKRVCRKYPKATSVLNPILETRILDLQCLPKMEFEILIGFNNFKFQSRLIKPNLALIARENLPLTP